MSSVQTAPCDRGVIISTPPASEACPERSKAWVLAATILGSSMASIDGSAVNVALPVIETDLVSSVTAMQWVVNAYSLCLAALMLIGGSAGDRFGRRRVFTLGIAAFAASSILCGLSASAIELIFARAAQGIGGALLIPSNLAIIGAIFDAKERGRAIGTWAGFSAITAALGPVIGGWLIDAISWRAIFFLNVPVALLTISITWRHMPESRGREAGGALDWQGAALAASGLAAVAFGLIESSSLGWHHPAVLSALVAGALLLAAFIRSEASRKTPMVPLDIFRSRTFSGVNLLTLLLYAALSGVFFVIPFNLIQVQNYPVTMAGAAFLPFTAVIGGLSRWSGGLIDRFGARRPLIVGPMIVASGFALLARPGIGGSYWIDFFPPMVILGFGMAISIAPLTATVMSSVSERRTGIASAINNAVCEIAALFAVALFGAVGVAVFNQALASRLAGLGLSPDAAGTVAKIGATLTGGSMPHLVSGQDRAIIAAIGPSFLVSFRLLMLSAAALAMLSSLCAALMIDPAEHRRLRTLNNDRR